MANAIYIPYDDEQPMAVRELTTLEDYQAVVGGYVEQIPSGLERTSFFVNDEAKFLPLGVNQRATILWWFHQPAMRFRDMIAGDVLLVGPTGRGGDIKDVPSPLVELLFTDATLRLEYTTTYSSRWRHVDEDYRWYVEAASSGLVLCRKSPDVVKVRIVPVTNG